ncbi:RNA-binding protein [bacterium]|nr:RNA-binding protein [bacterium]
MENKLFVGNLAFSITEQELRNMFDKVGAVDSVNLITDRETGRARGFGFVEMQSEDLANQAIEQLNGKEIEGREIVVNLAKPQTKRDGGGGGRDRNSGGGSRRW